MGLLGQAPKTIQYYWLNTLLIDPDNYITSSDCWPTSVIQLTRDTFAGAMEGRGNRTSIINLGYYETPI